MDARKGGFSSIDEYISSFPEDVQARLGEVRATIRAAAPGAEERISYGMPAFWQNGNLVYFAALKNHIGFYPTASGIEAFKDQLTAYEVTKGSIKFPNGQPLPLELISRVVEFRVSETSNKAAAKGSKKKGCAETGSTQNAS